MPLTRLPNWQKAFTDFLASRSSVPFAWGTNDCCLYAADAILAITGTDIATDFRGKYADEGSAFALIRSVTGGIDVAAAATHCATQHNLTENTHPLLAKRGDLVILDNAGTMIAGVVHLNGRDVVSVSATSAVRLPMTSIVRSWTLSNSWSQ